MNPVRVPFRFSCLRLSIRLLSLCCLSQYILSLSILSLSIYYLRASPRAAGPLAIRGKERGIIAFVVLVVKRAMEGSGWLNLS